MAGCAAIGSEMVLKPIQVSNEGLFVCFKEATILAKGIFDCFTFFEKLDILEMRMVEHYDHVDKFVIVEAPVTFQGNPKGLHFAENRSRFQRFMDKVIVTVTDMPVTHNPWDREHHQRNAIRRILDHAEADDIIIVTDADELIRRETLDFLRENDGYFMLEMTMYQYFMNLCATTERWTKPFAFTRSLADQVPDFNQVRTNQDEVLRRFGEIGRPIKNAGWHFTYLGGPERVRNKLRAFSHSDGWHAAMLEEGRLEAHVTAGYNVGNRDLCVYQPLDDSFPRVVIANEAKLIKAGYIREPYEALRALQLHSRDLHSRTGDLQRRLDDLRARHDALLQTSGILTACLAEVPHE